MEGRRGVLYLSMIFGEIVFYLDVLEVAREISLSKFKKFDAPRGPSMTTNTRA